MEATVNLAGYDILNIKASGDFQDRSSTSMLAAYMTNMRVFHRDILISQDGEEATGAALTEAHITGDTTRTAQLRAQLAMIGELNTAIAVVMGVDEPTLTALQHEDMIGAEVAVTAAQQRSTVQASVQGFETWRRGREEIMRRGHPTFSEQQLPRRHEGGKVQTATAGTMPLALAYADFSAAGQQPDAQQRGHPGVATAPAPKHYMYHYLCIYK